MTNKRRFPLPRLAATLIAHCLPPAVRESMLGDLEQMYRELAERGSRRRATLWYWSQVPSLGVRFLLRRIVHRRLYRKSTQSLHLEAGEHKRNHMLSDIWSDVRFTFRSLGRNPGFATATILVLGIGVGAVSLMFSTINTVVLQPLPFEQPDRLVWTWAASERIPQNSISYLDYMDYREGTDAFESMGAYMLFARNRILTGPNDAEQVRAYDVSASLFATLGVAPAIGRHFVPEEETSRSQVAILSQGFWQRRYGGDPSLIGSTITLDGLPVEIVGVMPSGFDFPMGAELWVPLTQSAGYASGRGNNNFFSVGRLREGVSLEQAQAQMDVVARDIAKTYPDWKAGWGVRLVSLHERFFGSARGSLLMLAGIISLVPLVACANVASLFMARAVTRRTELASRLALGASRSRVVRQLLTESVVVAVVGGALGLALAYAGGEALKSLAPAALPRLDAIGIDATVVGFTLVASLIMVPFFGIMPALRGTDMSIAETLKVGGGRGGSGRRSRFRNALVVAQVALSLVLMLASGLFLRSFVNLRGVDPGFRSENLLSFRLQLPSFKYEGDSQIQQTWDDLNRRLLAVPGVRSVGAVDRLVVTGRGPTNEVWAAERPPASSADEETATRRFATEGYFEAMGIPLLAGRVFDTRDGDEVNPVTVINETLARHFFPGEDPLGKTLILKWSSPLPLEIVGVTADIAELGLGPDTPPTFFLPARVSPSAVMRVLVRTEGSPLDAVASLRAAVSEVDRNIPLTAVQTIEARLSDSLFQPRFQTALVGTFALVALILSSIGLYGVLAWFVRQRAHETALRLALGAGAGRVVGLVIKRGMVLVGLGVAIGVGGALVGARLIQSVLFGVGIADPVTYAGVSLSLVVVALIACIVPAFRAVRLDPAEVLKAE